MVKKGLQKVLTMNDGCLNSLRVMGTILIFTPLIVVLPAILYAVTTGKSVSLGGGSAGYAAGLMIAAGLVTLIYVSIKEFKGER